MNRRGPAGLPPQLPAAAEDDGGGGGGMLGGGWGGFGKNLLNRLPIDTSSVTDRISGFNLDALQQNPGDGQNDDGDNGS